MNIEDEYGPIGSIDDDEKPKFASLDRPSECALGEIVHALVPILAAASIVIAVLLVRMPVISTLLSKFNGGLFAATLI